MIDTTKKYYYKAFGLRVSSEISMPELLQLNKQIDIVDIEIIIDDLSGVWDEIGKKGKFVVRKNLVIFQISDTATFCIQEGERVIVSPMKGSDADKIRLYILGSCMGALLLQRKVLPLHGSAVAIHGKAYAFVGYSGAGKSTLASALISRGYQLLSDDVIAVSLSQDSQLPIVTPSYPQQKLWQESLDHFGIENENYLPLFDRETKFAIPVSSHYTEQPLPLAGVFEVVKTEEDKIEFYCVQGLERLYMLYHHTFRNFLVPRLGLMEWHFNFCASFVNQINFFQLQRPSSAFTVNELVSMILNTVKEEELAI
jgi:hypothetical protein